MNCNRLIISFIAGVSALCGVAQDRAAQWADSVMATLTPRQRIGQLFVPRLDITDNAAGYALLHKMVVTEGVGGILLGKGTASEYVNVINRAQEEARVPLMVTLDGEWGPAMRVTDAPKFPFNMALGAINNDRLIYDYGMEVARQCRVLGIQVDFAPVLDVNSNPHNPVINYRSFGENPDRVAALGVQFCRGLQAGGVMAVGKHFPGHGDTSVDSHKALATVTHSRATLNVVDLKPFSACMKSGMGGIMVGHLDVPAIDASGTPASLSHKITTGLLKEELGYNGLIFTDALAMKGAVSRYGNNCVKALQAGADVMLSTANPVGDIEAMAVAVKVGTLKQSDIDARCRRILITKYNLGLNRRPAPGNASEAREMLNSPYTQALIDRLARASITLLKNDADLIPVPKLHRNRIAVLNIGAPADNEFTAYCRKYAEVEAFGLKNGVADAAVQKKIDEADIVIAAVYTDRPWAVEQFKKLETHAGLIPVFMINPYKMAQFGQPDTLSTLVAAYGDLPAQQRAAAQAIFGGINIDGSLPVNVDGVGRMGQGLKMLRSRLGFSSLAEEGMNPDLAVRIDSIVGQCIAERAFPGCQIAVVKNGNFVIDRAYGHLTYDSKSPAVTGTTLYDLASLTKPLATVPALMKLYGEGAFRVDDKAAKYVPELADNGKGDISVRELLQHTSGLKGIALNKIVTTVDSTLAKPKEKLRADLYSGSRSDSADMPVARGIWCGQAAADSIMDAVYRARMWPKKYCYSDLNFCLLGEMVSNIGGISLDELVESEILRPVGAYRTGFNPTLRGTKQMYAPTENDRTLRNQLLEGYVHDEIAAFSGGVQGNAGLFGTAGDVAKLCETFLQGGVYGPDRIFDEGTVDLFTASRSKDLRALGFDTALRYDSMKSAGCNGATYGHTGFTGTCFWIDPENDLIYVFLCNRVYPDRDNAAFTRLSPRTAIMQAINESLVGK